MNDRTLPAGIALTLALVAGPFDRVEAQAAEQYRLVNVGGDALPVEVEKEWRCREYVTAGTLKLGADSLWTLQYTTREVCGEREEIETEREDGRYSVVADTIRFRSDDDDDDDEDDLEVDDLATATRAADGTLTGRLRDGKTTLLFRR